MIGAQPDASKGEAIQFQVAVPWKSPFLCVVQAPSSQSPPPHTHIWPVEPTSIPLPFRAGPSPNPSNYGQLIMIGWDEEPRYCQKLSPFVRRQSCRRRQRLGSLHLGNGTAVLSLTSLFQRIPDRFECYTCCEPYAASQSEQITTQYAGPTQAKRGSKVQRNSARPKHIHWPTGGDRKPSLINQDGEC